MNMSIKRLVGSTVAILILVSATSSHSAIVTFTNEAAFQSAVDSLVSSGHATRINEDFDASPFGLATDMFPKQSVTNQGILWSPSVSGGFITTSTGGGNVVSSPYQMYATDSGGINHPVPDGFTLTPTDASTSLLAVGGWFNGTPLGKVGFTVDGDSALVDFGNDAILNNNQWTFLGFIQDDPAQGFQTVDIRQLEEGGDETRIIFADSFTIAPTVVPLPPALLLFFSGFSLFGILGIFRRRSAR